MVSRRSAGPLKKRMASSGTTGSHQDQAEDLKKATIRRLTDPSNEVRDSNTDFICYSVIIHNLINNY